MNPIVKTIASVDADFHEYLSGYKFQPQLTAKLDIIDEPLNHGILNEIVLWKVNRYVAMEPAVLDALNATAAVAMGEHRKAEGVLLQLLDVHGVDLPMASTFLRFRNPETFQIIDRHAYRAVYGVKYPIYTATPPKRKVGVYFDYLDRLVDLCDRKGLTFRTIDRLLYVFDKRENGSLD